MINCYLCDTYELRKWHKNIYGETDNTITVDSFNADGRSKRLMCILKKHIDKPTDSDRDDVLQELIKNADRLNKPYTIEVNDDAEHFHIHAVF